MAQYKGTYYARATQRIERQREQQRVPFQGPPPPPMSPPWGMRPQPPIHVVDHSADAPGGQPRGPWMNGQANGQANGLSRRNGPGDNGNRHQPHTGPLPKETHHPVAEVHEGAPVQDMPWFAQRDPGPYWPRAGDIMNRHGGTAAAQSRLKDLLRIIQDEGCSVVPVVDEGRRLLGVVCERDLLLRALSGDRPLSELTAGDFMTREVDAVVPQQDALQVIELMAQGGAAVLPVVDHGDRLLGMISLADLARCADHDPIIQDALQGLATRRSFWTRFCR